MISKNQLNRPDAENTFTWFDLLRSHMELYDISETLLAMSGASTWKSLEEMEQKIERTRQEIERLKAQHKQLMTEMRAPQPAEANADKAN